MENRADEIAALRMSGFTLQNIGDRVGITRERVRQILVRYHPESLHRPEDLLTKSDLQAELGIGWPKLEKLFGELYIYPVAGKFYPREVVARIKTLHKCKMCGKPIPRGNNVYCSTECRLEGAKYKNRPQAQREKHKALMRRWNKAHPERIKAIQKKAVDKYQAKKRAERP